MLDHVETVVRWAGFAVFATALVAGAIGAAAGRRRAPGRASGLAVTLRADLAYAVAAVPYFAVCRLLWVRLPVHPDAVQRWVALAVGTALGVVGAAAYFWGRRTLGEMYNVSTAFGSELYAEHRLVRRGPYRFVRHPMYIGLITSALGALLVYRMWTSVFMIACLPGAVIKARREDRLLADEFGERYQDYCKEVPAWVPRRNRHEGIGESRPPKQPFPGREPHNGCLVAFVVVIVIVGVVGLMVMSALNSMGDSCAPAENGSGLAALGAPLLLTSGGIGSLGVWFIEHTGKHRGRRDHDDGQRG